MSKSFLGIAGLVVGILNLGMCLVIVLGILGLLVVSEDEDDEGDEGASSEEATLKMYMNIDDGSGPSLTSAKDHKGWIEIDSFDQGVVAPTSSDSPLLSGQRVHDPVVITKAIDVSSPRFAGSMCNSTASTVTLDFMLSKADGTEDRYLRIVMDDAYIISLEPFASKDKSSPKLMDAAMEEVSFTYSKITFEYSSGSTFSETWSGSGPV